MPIFSNPLQDILFWHHPQPDRLNMASLRF